MKTCERCLIDKPLEDFYRNKSRPDGTAYWCKSCCKEYERLPHRKARHRKWRGSSKGIQRTKEYNKEHYLEDKPKQKARHAIHRLIKSGVIKRMPCKICGNNKSQAHHPDYTKPLDVVWLCQSHHYDIDRR